MLLNLYKNKWNNALKLQDQEDTTEESSEKVGNIAKWCQEWGKRVEDQTKK